MQTVRAFELIDSLDAELFGGSVTMPDGTSFDVGAALSEGGGIIVTDDETLITILDGYTALKRAAVPEDQRGYDGLKKDELLDLVDERNADEARADVELPDNATKDQIIDALRVADEVEGNR